MTNFSKSETQQHISNLIAASMFQPSDPSEIVAARKQADIVAYAQALQTHCEYAYGVSLFVRGNRNDFNSLLERFADVAVYVESSWDGVNFDWQAGIDRVIPSLIERASR